MKRANRLKPSRDSFKKAREFVMQHVDQWETPKPSREDIRRCIRKIALVLEEHRPALDSLLAKAKMEALDEVRGILQNHVYYSEHGLCGCQLHPVVKAGNMTPGRWLDHVWAALHSAAGGGK